MAGALASATILLSLGSELSAQEMHQMHDPWARIPAAAWGADGRLNLTQVPDDQRFSFLLGSHTYAFQGGEGTAEYEPAIDGRGVRGSIHGAVNGERFGGASLTWRDAEGRWTRRWIDTLGNVLKGRVEVAEDWNGSGLPALVSHLEELDGILFRHVWYDITRESFGTELLASQDGGETWVMARRMPYVRVH